MVLCKEKEDRLWVEKADAGSGWRMGRKRREGGRETSGPGAWARLPEDRGWQPAARWGCGDAETWDRVRGCVGGCTCAKSQVCLAPKPREETLELKRKQET